MGGLAKVAGTYERTIVAVGGTASIKGIPVLGRLDLGSGYLLFGAPDYLRLGGSLRADIPGDFVEGRADGEIGIGSGRFNLEVGGRACTVLCYGGVVLISSSGLAACGEATFKVPPSRSRPSSSRWCPRRP